METKKILLARDTWDSQNVMTITSFVEIKEQLLLDTVFIKFSQKIQNSPFISLQVNIFQIRILINIIKQVLSVIRKQQEKNIMINNENKRIEEYNNNFPEKKRDLLPKVQLKYLSPDKIITNKLGTKEEQKTITVAFDKETLYINGLYKEKKISVGFKKIEIEPLIDSLTHFANISTSKYYQQLHLDNLNFEPI